MHWSFASVDLEAAWIEGNESARWRSGAGHGPGSGSSASGSSLLEIDPGARLPRHTDSAEETIVVVTGKAVVLVGERSESLEAGHLAMIPANAPHEVRNAGDEVLRFVAVYADPNVTTTYEADVQPDGGRQREPVG